MRSFAYTVAALATLALVGCKTPQGSSLRDDGLAAGGIRCNFEKPDGSGDHYEFWATPTDGSKLNDVKNRISTTRQGEGAIKTYGTVAAVTEATVTENGKKGMRAFLKDQMSIDFKKFDCFGLETTSAKASYLCVAKAKGSTGKREALWATNTSDHKFMEDLTVYSSDCD